MADSDGRDMLRRVMSETLRAGGSHQAVRYGNSRVTYEELLERATAQGSHIRSQIGSEQSVALRFEATLHHIEAYLAILSADCTPFLLDPSTADEMLQTICEANGICCEVVPVAGALPKIQPSATDPSSPSTPRPLPSTAVCRFTTGTTSAPRCLEFSGLTVLNAARTWAEASALASDDTVLCVAPYSNGLAFNTSLLSVWLRGGTLVVKPARLMTSRAFFEVLEREGITRVIGFPTFYRHILQSDAKPHIATLRMLVSAASRLPLGDKLRLRERFGVPVLDYYGVAEVGPVTDGRGADEENCLGFPLPGVTIRIDGDSVTGGQVVVSTPYRATRYLSDPAAFEKRCEGAFYRTGDFGVMRNGMLYVTGRVDRLLKVGGRAVDPTVIEAAALGFEPVTDAAVIPVTSSSGETVAHLLVAPEADLVELRKHLRNVLGAKLLPAKISVQAQILRNAAGKVIPPLNPETADAAR